MRDAASVVRPAFRRYPSRSSRIFLSSFFPLFFGRTRERSLRGFRTGIRVSNIRVPRFSLPERLKTNCVLRAADWKFHDSRIRSLDLPEISVFVTRDPLPRKRVREIAGCGVSSRANESREIETLHSRFNHRRMKLLLFFIFSPSFFLSSAIRSDMLTADRMTDRDQDE